MLASVLDEHRRYLGDARRTALFAQALEELVEPGSVVVDIGAGTGVLGMLAARAGARRVYAIERSGLVGLTREIVRANGFADQIICVRGLAADVDLPERADVVVGDQLDGFIIDAGMLESFEDARKRFLLPAGRMIPSSVDWWLSPVALPSQRDRRRFWVEAHGDPSFDLAPVETFEASTRRYGEVAADDVLGGAVGPIRIKAGITENRLTLTGRSTILRAGQVDALAGWFNARLSSSVTMTNDPTASDRIQRGVSLLPLAKPVSVEPGEVLELAADVRPSTSFVAWGAAPVGQPLTLDSSLASELLSREDLHRAAPTYRPTLSRSGELLRRLLDLCDGTRTRADIAASIAAIRPEASPAALASLMSQVLAEHTRPI